MHRDGIGTRSPTPFDGSIERVGERLAVIAPRGELDAYSFEGFRDELLSVETGSIVIDLTEATFVDSLTLGAVVQASKRARARGDSLTVVCPDAHTRKVIEVTGLAQMFHLERSLSDAVARSLGP
jgi:anti-sigma B factor antagonist